MPTDDTLELLNRFEQALDNLAKMAKPNVSFPQLSTRSPSAAPIVRPAIVPYRAGLMGQDPSADYSQTVGATIQRGTSKPVKEEGKAGRANPTFHQSGFITSDRTGKEIAATEGHEKWHTALQDLRAKYHPAAVFDLVTKLGGRVHNDIYSNPVSKHLFDIAVKETPAEQKNASPYEEFFAYVHTFLNDPTFRKQVHENLGITDAQAQRDAYKHVDNIRKQAQTFADTFDESMIDPKYVPKTTQAPTGVTKSEDDLIKVYPTSEETSARMTPHKPSAWEGHESVEIFPIEGEHVYDWSNRKVPLYHHVYKKKALNGGWQSVLHAISTNDKPFDDYGMIGTSASGTQPVEEHLNDPWPAPKGYQHNFPWTSGQLPSVGETAVHGSSQGYGIGTLLYRQMLKYHGRLASDVSTSSGADGIWKKILSDPRVKGDTGFNDRYHRHWAEWHGEPMATPVKVLSLGGKSYNNYLEQQGLDKSESLIKVSRTPEEMSAGMTPHKPSHYEAYDTIETFPVGEMEWMNGRKGMLYHHVYKKPATKNGYVSYLHAISVDPNPLNETGIISSSTMGTESVQKFLADPFPAPKDKVNIPWKDGEVASIGETATGVRAQNRGLATLLYLDALKYHGRLMSDTLTSEGADKVWDKILKHPEVNGCHGHGDPFHRHWAEWKGDKSVPSNVIQMGGKSAYMLGLGKSEEGLAKTIGHLSFDSLKNNIHDPHEFGIIAPISAPVAVTRPRQIEIAERLKTNFPEEHETASQSKQTIKIARKTAQKVFSNPIAFGHNTSWNPPDEEAHARGHVAVAKEGTDSNLLGVVEHEKGHSLFDLVERKYGFEFRNKLAEYLVNSMPEHSRNYAKVYARLKGYSDTYPSQNEEIIMAHQDFLMSPEARREAYRKMRIVDEATKKRFEDFMKLGWQHLMRTSRQVRPNQIDPSIPVNDIPVPVKSGEGGILGKSEDKNSSIALDKIKNIVDLHIANNKINLNESFDQCFPRSLDFAQKYSHLGARLYQVAGFKPRLEQDVSPKWKRFEGSGRQSISHYIVKVGNWAVDLSSSQFGQKHSSVIKPWSEIEQVWDRQYDLGEDQHRFTKSEDKPTQIASVAVFNSDGHLLWGKRNDNGKHTMPGGHVEEGEHHLKAAVRELYEEAGLKPKDMEYLGSKVIKPHKGSKLIEVHAYKAVTNGKPHSKNDPDKECDKWDWVELRTGRVPHEIMQNLHSPKNVTLQLLGLQPEEVSKSEDILDTLNKFEEMFDLLFKGNGTK